MTEFTFITASDIHITDVNPRSRIDPFKESILNKLVQIRTVCEKVKADGLLIAGDLFHFKRPVANSHELVQNLIGVFGTFPCPIYMIEGNHDLTGNRLESLIGQPLGVLFRDKTIKQLRNETIEKQGHKISLIGIPYTDDFHPGEVKIPPRENNVVSQICLMHVYSSPTPGMLFKERIYGYKEFPTGPDIFVLGHYHLDQGIYEMDGRHFINIGSISRGTLTEDVIEHKPQIGLIKITVHDDHVTKDIQSIKLKVRPASEVFDLKKRKEEKEEVQQIEMFVDKLVLDSMQDTKERSIEEIIKDINAAQAVKDKALYFLHEALKQR